MRAKVFIAGGALAGVVLVGDPGVALADKPTEVSKCVENAVKTGQQADTCVKAPNPILPAANELVWGTLSFVILFYLLVRFAFPPVKKMMEERTNRIRRDLDEGERVRSEAEVAELRRRSEEDIRAAQQQALADLQASVKGLVIELAEKVVERNLDRETNMALIEGYISQVGSGRT